MAKPFTTWTVLPHGKLTELDDDILTVVGDLHMPVGDFPRRMTVVGLADGTLVVYSAIALDDNEMMELERHGTPSYLIVPSAIHRMDAMGWKERYPDIRVIAPPGAREKVAKIVPVDATSVDFPDPRVHFVVVPGTRQAEAALVVERAGGTTLIVNDVIWNVGHRPGFRGWLLKKLGFTGGDPRIPPLVVKKGIKDPNAFRRQLDEWAHLRNLRRIVVSHGDVVTADPPGVLRRLSARLAA